MIHFLRLISTFSRFFFKRASDFEQDSVPVAAELSAVLKPDSLSCRRSVDARRRRRLWPVIQIYYRYFNKRAGSVDCESPACERLLHIYWVVENVSARACYIHLSAVVHVSGTDERSSRVTQSLFEPFFFSPLSSPRHLPDFATTC